MRDLATLNAIEDIRQLEARYARYADGKRWADLAGLFTADGWFRPLDPAGHEIAHMSGRADIAAQLGARNPGAVQPIHQLLSHEIEIESATAARAVWAMADLVIRGDATMRGWGHYHVTYRKEDGRWLIATRTQTRTRLEFTDTDHPRGTA